MVLHLFRNGTGMITGHNTRLISTEPPASGTLMLGDRSIRIENEAVLETPLLSGVVLAHFACDDGSSCEIGAVTVRAGRAVSHNAESDTTVRLMHECDSLSQRCAELEAVCKRLSSKIEYDAIGFITDGGEKK